MSNPVKIILYTVLTVWMISSCTDFFAGFDLQDEWTILEYEKIILHYRPSGFSAEPSPNSEEAQFIIYNQSKYYSAIQDSINKNFNDNVLLYLYNKDEASLHIGSTYGGHSIPKYNTIYFSFFHSTKSYTDQYGIKNPFLGAHELVHIITHKTLGYPGTKLMSEGYANWLDGSYARFHIKDIVKSYLDTAPEKILNPTKLLFNTEISEDVYYPNSGIFIQYLVREYGIDKVNLLFNATPSTFQEEFEKIFSLNWEMMEINYAAYLKTL